MQKLSRTRKILLGIAVLVVLLAGAGAWLFLNPATPSIAAETGLSCSSIADCSRDCANQCPGGVRKLPCMSGCSTRCAEQGCGKSAQAPYADMTGCMRSHCIMDCISGPGPDCDACGAAECSSERDLCRAQECTLLP